MAKVIAIKTKKGSFVLEETDTQYLSILDGAFAPKTDGGVEYVGKMYSTFKQAQRAARYYNQKLNS